MLNCIDSNLDIETFELKYMLDNTKDFKHPVISGVYILFCRSVPYYVGSSIDVYRRIKEHRSKGIIRFNRFFIHQIYNRESVICNTREALLRTEQEYIQKLNPRFNIRYNENSNP